VLKHREFRHEQTIRELHFASDGVRVGEPLSHLRGLLAGTPLYE
jgi:circadian clock protein KaiC